MTGRGVRRRFTRRDKRKLGILLILAGLTVIAAALFMRYWDEQQYRTEGGTSRVELETATGDARTFLYKGKNYEMRDDVDAYLIMGIDKNDPVSRGSDAWDGGQADMIQVVVIDHAAKTWRLAAIDRNTIVPFEILTREGESLGVQNEQICLAHGFSYGLEDGCVKTADVVKDIFLNRKMNGYYALNMGGIARLNDLLGGVKITVTDAFLEMDPDLTVGEQLTLDGKQAEVFVRARKGTSDPTNAKRMERQREYLNGFITKADSLGTQEVLNIYDNMMDYVVTNIGSGTFANMLEVCRDYQQLEPVTIKGETVIEKGYEAFYMDSINRVETALELFYRVNEG